MSSEIVAQRFELHVDSHELWDRLRADLHGAREYAYLQMRSFEGDHVGTMLADLLRGIACIDRRMAIDDYSNFVLADKFLYSPRLLLGIGNQARLRRVVRCSVLRE